jgi:hypothetical protein
MMEVPVAQRVEVQFSHVLMHLFILQLGLNYDEL